MPYYAVSLCGHSLILFLSTGSFPDSFPVLGLKIEQHGNHAENKADGIGGHTILTSDNPGNQPCCRNADRPQGQQIGNGGIAYFPHAVYKGDNSVKYGISPCEGKYNPDVLYCDFQNCGILREKSQNGSGKEGHKQLQ